MHAHFSGSLSLRALSPVQALVNFHWDVCPRGQPCTFCLHIINMQQDAEKLPCINRDCGNESLCGRKFCQSCMTLPCMEMDKQVEAHSEAEVNHLQEGNGKGKVKEKKEKQEKKEKKKKKGNKEKKEKKEKTEKAEKTEMTEMTEKTEKTRKTEKNEEKKMMTTMTTKKCGDSTPLATETNEEVTIYGARPSDFMLLDIHDKIIRAKDDAIKSLKRKSCPNNIMSAEEHNANLSTKDDILGTKEVMIRDLQYNMQNHASPPQPLSSNQKKSKRDTLTPCNDVTENEMVEIPMPRLLRAGAEMGAPSAPRLHNITSSLCRNISGYGTTEQRERRTTAFHGKVKFTGLTQTLGQL